MPASDVESSFLGGNEFVDVDSFRELVEVEFTGAGAGVGGAADEAATSW